MYDRPNTVKLLEENIGGKNLFKIGPSIDFSDLTPKAQISKAEVGSCEIAQIIKLCTAKDKTERQLIK